MDVLTISFASAVNPAAALWMMVAVGLLAIAAIGALVFFKRKLAPKAVSQSDSVFTLEQLRQMYEAHQISENEYKALKEKILQENPS
jgi:hypothetical protein